MQKIFELKKKNLDFPDKNLALRNPNGLLAYGGDLKPERLIKAYKEGIFPWYKKEDPILWWYPRSRPIILINNFKKKKRVIEQSKKMNWDFKINSNFHKVVIKCSECKKNQKEAWMGEELIKAYKKLHTMKIAHSLETYENDKLIAGIYGVLTGSIFSVESMYQDKQDAGKAAFYALITLCKKANIKYVDTQVPNANMNDLGIQIISKNEYSDILKKYGQDDANAAFSNQEQEFIDIDAE